MCKVIEDLVIEEREEALQEGIQKGIQQGLQQGAKENATAAALRMLKTAKYAIEEVADISGLPLEEVEKLQTSRDM